VSVVFTTYLFERERFGLPSAGLFVARLIHSVRAASFGFFWRRLARAIVRKSSKCRTRSLVLRLLINSLVTSTLPFFINGDRKLRLPFHS
jgi:hypothetical protein